jgi:hypothetical protein
MGQERRALGAFLILAMLAAIPAVILRPSRPSRPALAERPGISHRVTFSRPTTMARNAVENMAPSAARASRAAVLAERRARAAERKCTSVPLYPPALPAAHHRDPALVRAVNDVRGVPPVTTIESFSLGHSAWLGGGALPTVFRFYQLRMHPIGFAVMPANTRRAIGIRPRGPVDSPPLLYTNRAGAALVQGLHSGDVRLTVFCGPVEF